MSAETFHNISRAMGFILLIASALVPVYAETLPASSVVSDRQSQLQSPTADEYAEGERLFFKATNMQECLAAMAKMDPEGKYAGGWCKMYEGNLVFQITNQSPNVDPVDFLISVDGKRLIEKEMEYNAGHHDEMIGVEVTPGKHVILVESKKGRAKQRLSVTVKDRLYVGIAYYYYTKKDFYGPAKRQFKFSTSKRPFAMM